MAKISLIEKNKQRIKCAKLFENKRNILKQKIYDKKLSLEERFEYINKLTSLPRDSSKIRIRNRCSITGRSRGNYRKFGISRHMIRDLSGKGYIPGLVKASW